MGITYKDSGVDIDAGNRLVELIKPLARSTFIDGVLTGIGGFGGLFELTPEYSRPVLVAGADGVGTKLKIAFETNKLDTVGIDLVAMNVNDILTVGAKPLFFLDYFATGRLEPERAAEVIKGIAEGCKIAGCALLGGETAELPGFYASGEFELAGFAVGVVDRDQIVDGSKVEPGDAVLGLKSSGLHSNGYSLARKVFFEVAKLSVDEVCPFDDARTVGEVLLEPTRIYVKPVLEVLSRFEVKAMAHITGGGLVENPPRTLPAGLGIRFERSAWEIPAIFKWIAQEGGIAWQEMFRTFNCGIGFVLIVASRDAQDVVEALKNLGVESAIIGEVIESDSERVAGLW